MARGVDQSLAVTQQEGPPSPRVEMDESLSSERGCIPTGKVVPVLHSERSGWFDGGQQCVCI